MINKIFQFTGIVLSVCLIVLLQFSCSGKKEADKGLIISDVHNGKTIEMNQGTEFKLRLKAQLSTGLRWEISKISDNIQKLGEPELETAQQNVTGATDLQVFKFKAAKKGESQIQLNYIQAKNINKDAKPEKTYSIKLKIK